MATLEEAVTKSLQCPICLELLNEPKLLSCAHTFCTPCVTLLYNSRWDGDAVFCPVCRKTTIIKDGDHSQLQTNLQVKTLVSDVAEAQQSCTHCQSEEGTPLTTPAVSYCHDCKTYMCVNCQNKHDEWKPNANHQVSIVDDIRHGKVVLKKKILCQEHEVGEREHECTDVCLTCRKIICIRCRVIDHEKKGHDVHGAVEYANNIKIQIDTLKVKAKNKVVAFKNHSSFVEEQKKRVTNHTNKRKTEIEEIYQECVRKLTMSREKLMNQCETVKDTLLAELNNQEAKDKSTVESIESACELAENSLKAPLEGDTVAIRQSLCDKLDDVIEDDPCMRDAAFVTRRAERIEFEPFEQNRDQNELDLGRVVYSDAWKLKTEVELTDDCMSEISATPDNRMAVGSTRGGIQIYTTDGRLQNTVLKEVSVVALGFLSDGRYVLIDGQNKMSLYTAQCEELGASFESLSDSELTADLTVSSDDHIYVCYRRPKKIKIFTPAGGKPVKEIACGGFEPHQIFCMKSKEAFLLRSIRSLRVIDDHGVVKHKLTKKGVYPYPAVRHDDSVLIAWIKHDEGLVTIDQYTSELNYVTTLINDYKIEKPKDRNWFYMQEYSLGEIALCTPDRLYIFH